MKVFVTVFLIFLLLFSLIFGVDESAMELHDTAFDRAMIAFALAKGLNAVISLIQGTELSFAPVGIGLNFSVGEVLDPFNDMVERFSWVMLAASVSLGIQKLLLVLSSKIFLQVALTLSIGASLLFIWMKKVHNQTYFIFSIKILLLLLVLRFGAIMFVYTSEIFYNSVLQEEYKSSSLVLENTKEELENIHSQNKTIIESNKDSSWYTSKYSEIKEQLNISQKIDSLSQNIEDTSRKIITLITMFIVQSILMPLLYIWFLIIVVKWIFRVELNHKFIHLLNH